MQLNKSQDVQIQSIAGASSGKPQGSKTPEKTPGLKRSRVAQQFRGSKKSQTIDGSQNTNIKNEQITQNFYNQNVIIMQNSPAASLSNFQQATNGQNLGQGLFPYMGPHV